MKKVTLRKGLVGRDGSSINLEADITDVTQAVIEAAVHRYRRDLERLYNEGELAFVTVGRLAHSAELFVQFMTKEE